MKGTANAAVLRKPLAQRSAYPAIIKSLTKALLKGKRLPPGDFAPLDELERSHRSILLERSATYGPIFKGLMENRVAVCVVDDAMGRRMLRTHFASMGQVSIQISQLFPNGHLRQMEGDTHREYRMALGRGIAAIDFNSLTPDFETIANDGLGLLQGRETAADLTDALTRIANNFMLLLFFGAKPADDFSQALLTRYHRLGPNGVVWNITDRQVEAYQDLHNLLGDKVATGQLPAASCLLTRLATSGRIDETLLGNLIYMVELARYDLRGLLRWVLKHAADHPDWLARIMQETDEMAQKRGSLSEAFVLEVLRLEQSERLMRDVKEDFVFDGFLIPKDSLVRICMWENHKSPTVFPRPFAFDPARFAGAVATGDVFLPFGVDHHQCPFSSLSVKLAMVFLRQIGRGYRVRAYDGDPPVRGPYHWQPSPGLRVALHPRGDSAS